VIGIEVGLFVRANSLHLRLEIADKSAGILLSNTHMKNHELDCRGLHCPMPIVRISQTMNGLQIGEVLKVQADDPAFRADIVAWSQMTGNELISIEEGEGITANLKRSA